MELTIEFTNKYIDITEQKISSGKVVIKKYIRGKMPEGAFQNGIVVNTGLVAKEIKELLKKQQIHTKKAVLCANGMDVIRKDVKIPKGPERHVRGLLENELNKAEILKKGYLFDYIPIDSESEEKDGYRTYGVFMLPEELIKNYLSTLKQSGLDLTMIVPISQSMEKLAGLLELDRKKELTILVSAENTEVNLLMTGEGIKSVHRMITVEEKEQMEENVFIVSAVNRFQNFATPENQALESLVESISKMVQFQSQTYAGKKIGNIMIYGELALSRQFLEDVEQRCQIPVEICRLPKERVNFRESADREGFLGHSGMGSSCGKLLGMKKELSFVNIPGSSRYTSVREQIPLLAGLGCILILSMVYGKIMLDNLRLEREMEVLQTKIADITSQEEYQRKLEVERLITELTAYNQNSQICIELMTEKERLTPEMFSSVDSILLPQIVIQTYGYENRTAIFQCISTYQDGPADLARSITDAKLFDDVKYTGFQAQEDINGAAYYSFQIECSKKR